MRKYKLAYIFNNYTLFLMLYAVLLTLALIPHYASGTVILGGEGDFVLDFSVHLSKYSFAWFPTYDVGIRNTSPSGTGLNILLLWIIENLTGNVAITNFALIFSIYFFPFFAMYLLCKEIKATPFISFVSSLFYVVNPFMLYYLTSLNQWNVFSVSVMPLFLWLILKYYNNNFKLFVSFGIISTVFSFAYTNQPMLIIIQISIALSTFIASYCHNKKFVPIEILKKCGILIASFVLFNSWWVLNLFWSIGDAQKIYTHAFAQSWLTTTVTGHGAIIAKTLSLTTIIGKDPSYDFFTYWYSTTYAKLITLVPIIMIASLVLVVKNGKTRNLFNSSVLGILLIILFLLKGNANPFGFVYEFMFKYIPYFYIFKTPVEKFGLLYVFIFSILLLFAICGIKNQKYYKPVLGIFTAYLLFCSVPVITGNIVPDYKVSDNKYASRRYKDKVEYKQFREEVNKDVSDYRILSLPGNGNYSISMPNWNNKYYTGLDPLVMNINKPSVTSYSGLDTLNLLFRNISLINYRKLLGIYNIKKILINEDLYPWFGFVETETVPELERIFDTFMSSKKWGSVSLYDNQDYFLPRIYASSAPY